MLLAKFAKIRCMRKLGALQYIYAFLLGGGGFGCPLLVSANNCMFMSRQCQV